ncbi:MAG: hypothetical protein CVV22_12425 [Ignavibacteriae bacterium HGW-Ignavibacteriae-1]|jgi:hypothetical protein|nr:MAG: hypothetical protein CVV22_12425 [Ignavibacteriae bacterium HGW-Ignavibacteriae-1]
MTDIELDEIHLDEKYITQIQDGVLFYPCSGYDVKLPISLFAPYVNQFIFADLCEYRNLKNPKFKELINLPSNYKLQKSVIKGAVESDFTQHWNYRSIEPGVRDFKYYDKNTQHRVSVLFRRGYGIYALRDLVSELDVFFYRGDSMGEGGSDARWNTRPSISCTLSKLKDGGLYITDGSNCLQREYSFLKNYQNEYNKKEYPPGRDYFDKSGNMFSCVGEIGPRYGPTFVWKVTKNKDFNDLQSTKNDFERAQKLFFHVNELQNSSDDSNSFYPMTQKSNSL